MTSVLLIDNHSPSRSAAALALAAAGYPVIEAADARGALAALRDHRPGCVVLGLPVANLKSHGLWDYLQTWGPRLPIVLVADGPDAGTERLGGQIAARAMVFRPCTDEALRAGVEQAVSHAAAIAAGV